MKSETVRLVALLISSVMLIGGGFLVYKRTTGLNAATVQTLGIVLFIPTIIILSVTQALPPEVLATLCGVLIGYIFGRAGDGK